MSRAKKALATSATTTTSATTSTTMRMTPFITKSKIAVVLAVLCCFISEFCAAGFEFQPAKSAGDRVEEDVTSKKQWHVAGYWIDNQMHAKKQIPILAFKEVGKEGKKRETLVYLLRKAVELDKKGRFDHYKFSMRALKQEDQDDIITGSPQLLFVPDPDTFRDSPKKGKEAAMIPAMKMPLSVVPDISILQAEWDTMEFHNDKKGKKKEEWLKEFAPRLSAPAFLQRLSISVREMTGGNGKKGTSSNIRMVFVGPPSTTRHRKGFNREAQLKHHSLYVYASEILASERRQFGQSGAASVCPTYDYHYSTFNESAIGGVNLPHFTVRVENEENENHEDTWYYVEIAPGRWVWRMEDATGGPIIPDHEVPSCIVKIVDLLRDQIAYQLIVEEYIYMQFEECLKSRERVNTGRKKDKKPLERTSSDADNPHALQRTQSEIESLIRSDSVSSPHDILKNIQKVGVPPELGGLLVKKFGNLQFPSSVSSERLEQCPGMGDVPWIYMYQGESSDRKHMKEMFTERKKK